MPDLNSTGPEARALVPEHLQQLLAVCEELHHLDFYGLRSGAKVLLHELLPGARLEFLAEPPAAGDTDGAAADGGPPVRRSGWHFAPPEPLWVTVTAEAGLPDVEFMLEYFHTELLAALANAGYAEELDRQARVDWLTGLPGLMQLERRLLAGLGSEQLLGLVATGPAADVPPAELQAARLKLRAVARSLRLLLTEDEEAFSPGDGLLALLVPEQQRQRFMAFFKREIPGVSTAWVRATEAHGLELLRLGEARLDQPDAMPAARPEAVSPAGEAEANGIAVLSGSSILGDLTDPGLTDWRLQVPVTLILDEPAGFALETLKTETLEAPVVVTGCNSQGYLLDLQELQPAGLLLRPASLADLRNKLELAATGERMYSGPLLNEQGLLERERVVWRLIAAGYDNEKLAGQLGVQAKTAANYVSELLDKLSLPDRATLALSYWDCV